MKNGLLLQILLTFSSLSLVAIGGTNVVIPEIHRQVVEQLAWMDDPTFTTLFAITQVAPGPNTIIVGLIGWHMAGLAGLIIATLATIVPSSLLAFSAARLVRRYADLSWMGPVKSGLVPVAVGLVLASGLIMGRAADSDALTVIITAGAAAFIFLTDRSPLWVLAAGAVAAITAGLAQGMALFG